METVKRKPNRKIIIRNNKIGITCCCPSIELDSTGGDDGYNETFQLVKQKCKYDFFVVFTAFFVPDALLLSADGNIIYESGCIGESIGQPSFVQSFVTMPANAETFNITVIPNCTGDTEGTVWTLAITGVCIKPSEP